MLRDVLCAVQVVHTQARIRICSHVALVRTLLNVASYALQQQSCFHKHCLK